MPTETTSVKAASTAARMRPGRIAALPARFTAPGPGLAAALAATRTAALALLAMALAPGSALAQRAPPAERYYQVEVLVFAQPAGASVELPPRQPEEALAGTPGDAAGEDHDDAGGELSDEMPGQVPGGLPDSFGPPRAAGQLAAEARQLERNGYRVLWHQAWTQPPSTRDGVPLALLSALGQGPATPALTGSIDLSTRRFLHLGMDLELRSADGLAAELSQRRRIRPGQLHYFDHPRIGAIAIVQPLESAPATAGQPAEPDDAAGAEPAP